MTELEELKAEIVKLRGEVARLSGLLASIPIVPAVPYIAPTQPPSPSPGWPVTYPTGPYPGWPYVTCGGAFFDKGRNDIAVFSRDHWAGGTVLASGDGDTRFGGSPA